MKIYTTNVQYKLLFACILQTYGSLLSRLKNRYEYFPHNTKDFITDDLNYINNDFSPENNTPAINVDQMSVPLNEDNSKISKWYGHTSQMTHIKNITRVTEFQKRSLTSEAYYEYYDIDKWPNIKLFSVSTLSRFQPNIATTSPTCKRKRTWPSYFPPKFISKVQEELDEALRPWKSTEPHISNILTNFSNQSINATRTKRFEVQASCYMCGLDQEGIPIETNCYHAFESDEYIYRTLKRHYKVKCIQDRETKQVRHRLYGPMYTGGCFKRFLDLGVVYNERGCRTREPTVGKSYASRRLARLERMLEDKEDGCVFSPFASLTPFSKAVSLYARYHVCVCRGHFCNHNPNLFPSHLNIIILVMFSDKILQQ